MNLKPVQVFKFGGVAVGTPEAVRIAAGHVQAAAPGVAVVVSAMAGVTDALLAGALAAAAGRARVAARVARDFQQRHLHLVHSLLSHRANVRVLEAALAKSTAEYADICSSVRVLRELTPQTRDAAAARGERMLAALFTAVLDERGIAARCIDATRVVFTRRQGTELWPDFARSERAAARLLRPILAGGGVAVVPGFIGRGPDGAVVTLGRGGSDFSAAILARVLHAASVTLFKEVDGLLTADPGVVREARVVPELHYREAAELAYYGARVLHPRTMIPLMEPGIPLFIRNTFNSGFSGTRIAGRVKASPYPVKALTAIHGQTLLSIEGKGMMGVPGIASRTFTALARGGHSVAMISQASSESSICFVVPSTEAPDAARALGEAFAPELRGGLVDAVRAEPRVALVAVVGLGMRGAPGIAARTFGALARERINILAIAQGSSELNITMALREADVAVALNALHREYQLEKLRPLADTHGRAVSLTLFGLGQIGRELGHQVATRQNYFRHDLGLDLRCVAVLDSTGCRVEPEGMSAAELVELLQAKASGRGVAGAARGAAHRGALERSIAELKKHVWPLPAFRPVLADLSAAETWPMLRESLDHGFHLVLANKRPLAVAQLQYDALFAEARFRGLSLRYEATVGAGLPVLDTLAKLRDAGDNVETVLGCLSGTLGFLMTQLEQGVAFSAAVRLAREAGYTEPHPRDDLSGADVARKALILARTLGHRLNIEDIQVTPLFPASLDHESPDTFVRGLAALDREYAGRIHAARRRKQVLRYVARIDASGVRVGVEAVAEGSPMGRLAGTDNQVALYSRRYRTNPLVVTGPGAGAEVTAAGVLNDIIAIALGDARRGRR